MTEYPSNIILYWIFIVFTGWKYCDTNWIWRAFLGQCIAFDSLSEHFHRIILLSCSQSIGSLVWCNFLPLQLNLRRVSPISHPQHWLPLRGGTRGCSTFWRLHGEMSRWVDPGRKLLLFPLHRNHKKDDGLIKLILLPKSFLDWFWTGLGLC